MNVPRHIKTYTMIIKLFRQGLTTESAVVCADQSWISCIFLHSYIACCEPVKWPPVKGVVEICA